MAKATYFNYTLGTAHFYISKFTSQEFRSEFPALPIRVYVDVATLCIKFHDVGINELLSVSQKHIQILQRHIGIRKYHYLNFDQVPHLDPKSHGWPHI